IAPSSRPPPQRTPASPTSAHRPPPRRTRRRGLARSGRAGRWWSLVLLGFVDVFLPRFGVSDGGVECFIFPPFKIPARTRDGRFGGGRFRARIMGRNGVVVGGHGMASVSRIVECVVPGAGIEPAHIRTSRGVMRQKDGPSKPCPGCAVCGHPPCWGAGCCGGAG